VGSRWRLGSDRDGSSVRSRTRAPRICTIAAPLLIVTTSLDEGSTIEQLFGERDDVTLVGVFARSGSSEPVVDLRSDTASIETAKRLPAVSLDRTRGDRQHTTEIAGLIADAIDGTAAATVAISLGLRGGDDLEASDAALLARRGARQRIRWVCYAVGDSDADAGGVARRRVSLFVRGVRLEPVALAEAPLGTSARFWEIRAPHRY
jgi:hypothetical protein